ncbi:ankyrin repeat and protein kinase domain-containing protein 1 isoform X3 [Fukomys damarensis]|uniref:Ankyrin repeat and protein kinase domain-containing protein 1 n=1 Tax=Fukomys damarensis TaxID=885580 RepID=A0A091DKX7_FUKDA|nr:ankyrin repeat and protein kinase domain-containing protein 1 isoform X3 [Fukomys damarensis]KFO31128.1 Ankyrin repeat and protein kinase domain-containing protein 1 [Fukomys damarensis]
MAAGPVEQRLGSLTIFTRADFEDDWRQVASGGFSQVFQARHKRWRTQYAIKCSLSPQQDATSSDVNSLIEEATKMEKIKFQYIVSIYGVCMQPLGIVMEFMANGSLEKMLPTHNLSWQLKFRIIHETSLAMNFLHSIKPPLLHLDLKPGNILLDNNMHVKISDFGLSKWMEQSTRMQYIERSALRGTLSYIPPEVFLESNKAPGPNYDVYSFGIVIWELLTQKKPYTGLNMMTIIIQVAAGMRPSLQPVSEEWPGEAQQMVDLMRRCWDQDPKKRPCFLDITVETDMLLSLLQCPVADPEVEALARKVSCKPSLRHQPQQVSEEAGQELMDSDSGDYMKQVLQLSDSESLVPSDEELRIYENKVTPLHFLVAQGSVEQVRLLLAHEVDVDCQTASGYTPLLIAAQDQQPDLCALLLTHGADANLVDEDDWAPLHFAAQNGDDRTARLLLDHGALVDAQEHEGWTPLHLATQNNFENVARLLISRQADPNLCEAEGKTPLHMAAYFGHVSLVKLLTSQGAELDAQQRNLRTPLHLAVERGKVRAIQYLLKSGAATDALDQSGYSPLHIAAARGKYLICKMLLRYGASLELPTQQGWTSLHLATYKGHVEIIHLLAESHADMGALGSMKWTPLHLAARHGEEMVLSALLQCGAHPNTAEQSGWTPLHLAVQRGAFLSVIKLLEHGADVHACNKVGWTPAHLAALKGNTAILKVLVRDGAQLDIQDEVGCTPLQLALQSQKQSIVAFLQGKEPSLAILGSVEPGAQMEV